MDETEYEARMWDHFKSIESENYHLKNQLANKNRELKALKKSYASLNMKYKKVMGSKKDKYNNGRRMK